MLIQTCNISSHVANILILNKRAAELVIFHQSVQLSYMIAASCVIVECIFIAD